MTAPIEDYALLGDGRGAALLGRTGSIDWLCRPRFDSPAWFSALLGTPDHGRWLLAPSDVVASAAAPEGAPITSTTREYLSGTTVLRTVHSTPSGVVEVLDAMPRAAQNGIVVRTASCTSGTVEMQQDWRVRPSYGAEAPELHGTDGVWTAGPARLRSPVPARGAFTLAAGESVTLVMGEEPGLPDPDEARALVDRTIADDREWIARAADGLPHEDAVRRSLLTLRTLLYAPTGAGVAAPTTSLPEDFGGSRNWDYRYCWLRDSAFHLTALASAGFTEEPERWQRWLVSAMGPGASAVQPLYRIDGGRDLEESHLDHLPGYLDSRPVRVGNAAAEQMQFDVYGEILDALHVIGEHGVAPSEACWRMVTALLEDLSGRLDEDDHGIWEIRGPKRRFTHSRVMIWASYDRGLQLAETHGLPAPVEEWRRIRDELREEILEHGFDEDRGTFTQHYGTAEVDASLLMLPMVGFIAGDDPRMLGTIAAIEEDLLRGGLPLRYRTESGVDGLEGDEHTFLICAFWLVIAYASAGLRAKAEALFERLVGLTNDVGLLSEEYDTTHDRMAGNFPQAFSHIGLVLAALALAE